MKSVPHHITFPDFKTNITIKLKGIALKYQGKKLKKLFFYSLSEPFGILSLKFA